MKYTERDFWSALAGGDSVLCRTEKEVLAGKDSLEYLYDLFGKQIEIETISPPCFVVFKGGKHIFSKDANGGEKIPISEFAL